MDYQAYIPPLPPSQWCQSLFGLATVLVLSIAVLPSSLQRLVLDYGARGNVPTPTAAEKGREDDGDWLERHVSVITSRTRVPHAWFTTFYWTSLATSAFWACQFALDGRLFHSIASREAESAASGRRHPDELAQTLQGVAMAWALMVIQGCRRLYEQLHVSKPSASTMWVVHWLLGATFYIGVGAALWIEGSESLLATRKLRLSAVYVVPPPGRVLGTVVFLMGSVAQHRCHKHLASLKKYSLPTEGLFRYLVCPHYTCECLLYLALALVAAPHGHLLNRSVLSALVFTVVNLGVTARGTRRWYEARFGVERLAARSTMIPLVY